MAVSGWAARFGKVRWRAAFAAARWLYGQGRERLDKNLTPFEQRELWELLKKSRGRRARLSRREQDRFRALVRSGVFGRD
jgi:hypothetical protein